MIFSDGGCYGTKKDGKIAGGLNRFLKVVKVVNLVSGIFALCGLAILMIGYAINPKGIVEPSVHTLSFGDQLFQWIFDYFDFRYFGAEQLAQSEMIQSVNFTYRVNLWFLAGFFLLLLISHIFRYGSELQQLSDETL